MVVKKTLRYMFQKSSVCATKFKHLIFISIEQLVTKAKKKSMLTKTRRKDKTQHLIFNK